MELQPTMSSFVLTDVNSVRLYAVCLCIMEEVDLEKFAASIQIPLDPELRAHSDQKELRKSISSKLLALHEENSSSLHRTAGSSSYSARHTLLLPKALVLVSHYPFFDLFRSFISHLYRVSLSNSPLPIERYIANFVREVPLPPRGQIEVRVNLPDKVLVAQRSAKNALPSLGFSLRPLFSLLSLENIIAVFECLLVEAKVALISSKYSLLTPVASGLLALLFPFEWQGAFIPIMPATMIDVLDAPVPFIVGLHSSALEDRDPPPEVVYVDLDNDSVDLGVDEETGEPRQPPSLPKRAVDKLKKTLRDIVPEVLWSKATVHKSLSKADLAFPVNEHMVPISTFGFEAGILELRSPDPVTTGDKPAKAKADKGWLDRPKVDKPSGGGGAGGGGGYMGLSVFGSGAKKGVSHGKEEAEPAAVGARGGEAPAVHGAVDDNESNSSRPGSPILISTASEEGGDLSLHSPFPHEPEVRAAFLRLFVFLYKGYRKYISIPNANDAAPESLFDRDGFLAKADHLPENSHGVMENVMNSQMFERFLHDVISQPDRPEVRFFDESIVAKMNRSALAKHEPTPFLDDRSDAVNETFQPPPPSNWGLPADGRVYNYSQGFPSRLDQTRIGAVREPARLVKSAELVRKASTAQSLIHYSMLHRSGHKAAPPMRSMLLSMGRNKTRAHPRPKHSLSASLLTRPSSFSSDAGHDASDAGGGAQSFLGRVLG